MNSRKNALKHGLLAGPVTIAEAGEEKQDWMEFADTLKTELRAEGCLQLELVESLAFDLKRQHRAAMLEATTMAAYFRVEALIQDAREGLVLKGALPLDLLLRYEASIRRRIAQQIALLNRLQERSVPSVHEEATPPERGH